MSEQVVNTPATESTSENKELSGSSSSNGTDPGYEAWLKQSDSILDNGGLKLEDMESKNEDPEEEEHEEDSSTDEHVEEKKKPKKEPAPSTVKYKVDGEEFEVDIKDVPTLLSKAAGADKRFQEAANIRSEAKEFITYMKTNPLKALEKLGVDFEQMAIDHVHELIKVEKMTPEQKEAYDIKKENERLKAEKEESESKSKAQREAEERRQLEEATIQAQQTIESEIIDVFESNPDLPRNRAVADRFIHYLQMAAAQGYYPEVSELTHLVKNDFADFIRKNNVSEFKKKQQETKRKDEQPKKSKPGKRITSIYDLLD